MQSTHQAETTLAPKGKTPVVERTGKGFYMNMISALTNKGRLVFMVVDGNFNGVVFLTFLQKLIRAQRQKVFLIADAHPVYIQKMVEQWLVEHKPRIELFLCLVQPGIKPR